MSSKAFRLEAVSYMWREEAEQEDGYTSSTTVLSPPAESGDELDDMLFPDDDDADGGGSGDPFAGLQIKVHQGLPAI